jgi:hypothetical protein
MISHRLMGRGRLMVAVCLLGALATNASAAHIPGMSQLGGYTYIDRNNDGQIAFINDPNPEYAIGNVSISLFSVVNNVETFISQIQSDQNGRYFFENIVPGTYSVRQTQPIEYVDGIDTLGLLQSLVGGPIPPGASAGTAGNDVFSDIVLVPDVKGEYYNFGERGLAAGFVSKRFLFASAPPLTPLVPEPGTVLLALAAMGGQQFVRRRRLRR